MKASVVEKAKFKLWPPLSSKLVNQKQYRIPGGITEISATKSGDSHHILIQFYIFGLCRRQMNLGEWQWIIISFTRW